MNILPNDFHINLHHIQLPISPPFYNYVYTAFNEVQNSIVFVFRGFYPLLHWRLLLLLLIIGSPFHVRSTTMSRLFEQSNGPFFSFTCMPYMRSGFMLLSESALFLLFVGCVYIWFKFHHPIHKLTIRAFHFVHWRPYHFICNRISVVFINMNVYCTNIFTGNGQAYK